jgi:tryptophan halogenase
MNIIIVGGGTAGWMTASYLSKKTDWDITVIQSQDIPIIGVGESTLPSMYDFIHDCGLTEQDLFDNCDAVRKYTIKHKNWHGESWFHHFCFDEAEHDEQMRWMENYELPDKKWRHAYHIDANKFGIMLRDKVALPNGVKLETRTLDTIDDLQADLIINCTGFNKLFPKREMVSTRLKNNCAVVAPSYDKELKYYTETTAMSNGWMWNIYLQNRIGNGYVFSTEHQTVEDAKREFIEKCPYTLELDKMRVLHWESKYCPTPYQDNILNIGLSAGFIEPLEAQAIWLIQYQIEMLVKLYGKQKVYNRQYVKVVKHIEDFLALHYEATSKNTPYWQNQVKEIEIKKKPFTIFDEYSFRCLANGYALPYTLKH